MTPPHHEDDDLDPRAIEEQRREKAARPLAQSATMQPGDRWQSINGIDHYKEMAMRTLAENVKANDPGIFADPRSAMLWNAASGMASEAGEINEILKKVYFHGHPFDEACEIHLKKETGDYMWYPMLLCFAMGWNPSEILAMNIEKLKARYPEGFSTERSVNRVPGDI